MSAVLKLIMTADDYGLNPATNSAILECAEIGNITSVSCLVNSPHWNSAAPLEASDRLSLGVHWNLTQGRPVLKQTQVPSLVSASGEFHDLDSLRRRWVFNRVRGAEIEAELTAQWEILRRRAGEPAFWNTHENVHVFPGLHGLFSGLALRLGIRAMRTRVAVPISTNGAVKMKSPRIFSSLKQRLIRKWDRSAVNLGIGMPEGLIQLLPPLQDDNPFHQTEWLGRIGRGKTLELPVHPARIAESADFGNIQARRLKEYLALVDPQFRSGLEKRGVRLVSFACLSADQLSPSSHP